MPDNTRCAELGIAAMRSGDPDDSLDVGDPITAAVDTIANILHGLDHLSEGDEVDYDAVLRRARKHHNAERLGLD